MKTQKFLGQAGRLRNVIVVAALAASFALPTVASAAVSIKSGDTCSKSQLNKTSGTLKCAYNSKTKNIRGLPLQNQSESGLANKVGRCGSAI